MKLLADENVDRAVVLWLGAAGYDILWIYDIARGANDPEVLRLANEDRRVLLTGDLDFGEHVFRNGLAAAGVILLRLTPSSEERRLALLQHHWPVFAERAAGHFVVVGDRRIRIRPLP